MIKYTKIIFVLISLSIIFSPNSAFAKDCSDYQLLSHEWNKCKLNLKKLKKLNPLNKLKKKDNAISNDNKSEKKVLIKSKKIDEINKNCSTLADCLLKRKKND